ncbi:hypothetical protein I9W82_003680 [Candida metapsilosis]|uniref:Uncharacterized protein n=1 Tax=Candida metapsilosis TaxID=273372 RepID=A0A8H7ZBT4_9ASCO|nr:hypothetical protein I9W82_003680 [Candida metapsilosis]
MSLNPQEQVYKEYLNYDWNADKDFQDGLKEIFDAYLTTKKEQNPLQEQQEPSISSLDRAQLTNQAKSFFFCQKTGHILNLEDFEQWKIHNGDKFIKNGQINELDDEQDKKEKENENENGASSDEPPYSSNYQQLAELIMSGKPVPGIKEIPPVVLTDQGSEPSAAQRKKPWEVNN